MRSDLVEWADDHGEQSDEEQYRMDHPEEEMEVIYAYTRKQAIEDGQQVQVPEEIQGSNHFNFPIFITDSIINMIDAKFDATGYSEDKVEQMKEFCFNQWLNRILAWVRYLIKTQQPESIMNFTIPELSEECLISEVGAYDIDDPRPSITIMSWRDR